MKILQINGGVFGSTGKIMFGIAQAAEAAGHEVLCAAPITKTNRYKQPSRPYVRIGNYYTRLANVLLSRLTGLHDCFAWFATARLLQRVKVFAPDVIHLHNLHGSYLNLPMLFHFIKKHDLPVVHTTHDCWSFTGGCPHFDMIGCEKWRTACHHCPQYRDYPKSCVDTSKWVHRQKKKWFAGLNLTLITPSQWIGDQAKQSFLKNCPALVIHNGTDLSVFKPTKSDFRRRHGLEGKKLVLGVAFGWGVRKGLDVFVSMADKLPADYQIVLVGTDEQTEAQLPENVLPIRRTQNQQELAEIYTACDVFANPTREEMFGLVNVEALACGTPVVTFATGGCVECIDDTCGVAVPKNDETAMLDEIQRVCEQRPFSAEACLKRAEVFCTEDKYTKTVELYEHLDER